jgi:anti-sigma28 factor (negative regulator of flagellin synthesis)
MRHMGGVGADRARRRRLTRLHRRITRGEYRVPAEAVADAILAAWGRGWAQGSGGEGRSGFRP